jgi:small GTP-binding protein
MRHVLAMLSSCDFLNDDLDISTFLAYKRKLRLKAAIKRLSGSPNEQRKLKIVFLGESGVGKGWLYHRLNGKQGDPNEPPTLSGRCFPFWTRFREGTDVQLMFFDTAWEERYRSLTRKYVQDCSCAIIVFNVIERQGFEKLPIWIRMVQDSVHREAKFILVGTQIDQESERVVSIEEGYRFAKENGALSYVEVSGKTGENVHEIVDLIEAFCLPVDPVVDDLSGVQLTFPTPVRSFRWCC